MVRNAADANASVASVQRLTALAATAPEADVPLTHDTCPRDGWPSGGRLEFNNVVFSYLPQARGQRRWRGARAESARVHARRLPFATRPAPPPPFPRRPPRC